MAIPFNKIPINQLMYHQKAYEIIDDMGHHIVGEKWDMVSFEFFVLAEKSYDTPYQAIFKHIEDGSCFNHLDKETPFLKFGEAGQHYAFELFLSQPCGWCSRGAPIFWAYAARQFTNDKLPMNPKELEDKYLSIAKEFGIPTTAKDDEYVCVKRFAAGGMSSGQVGGYFIEESLKTLLRRNGLY